MVFIVLVSVLQLVVFSFGSRLGFWSLPATGRERYEAMLSTADLAPVAMFPDKCVESNKRDEQHHEHEDHYYDRIDPNV